MYRSSERWARLLDASLERRSNPRFPVTMMVRYAASDRLVSVAACTGRTIDLSSSGLSFTADAPLPVGLRLDVVIDWPFLRDRAVPVQLIASGVVVRTNGTVAALQIQRHEFRTRRMGLKAVSRKEWVN
jgi:hypothetical protein